jgi:hypothetical protein
MAAMKKEIEERALAAACRAGLIVPRGEVISCEEPDFRIESETEVLGIELTELLPPPKNESFSSPAAEESFHKDVVNIAELMYYRMPGALPLRVTAYFWNIKRGKNKKREMAEALVGFVKSHRAQAAPVVTFEKRNDLPDGFSVISIDSNPGCWWSGESVENTLYGIRQQLASRMAAKNKRVSRYRETLPNLPIWLLLYSGAEVSRSIEMPHGIGEWSFPFDFDRVFFFSSLSNRVEESANRTAFSVFCDFERCHHRFLSSVR